MARFNPGLNRLDPHSVRVARVSDHALGSHATAGLGFHPGVMSRLAPESVNGVHALAAHLAPCGKVEYSVFELFGAGIDRRETFDSRDGSLERIRGWNGYRLIPPSNCATSSVAAFQIAVR